MSDINDSYQFIYKIDSKREILIDHELLQKLNDGDYSVLSKNNITLNIVGLEFFELLFDDGKKLKVFRYDIPCKLKDFDKVINIVSYDHLKIILEKKIEEKVYKNPCLYLKSTGEYVNIDLDKIEETNIHFEEYIEIKEKHIIDKENLINNIFKEQEELYKLTNQEKYTYKYISPNFNSYFPNLKVNLEDEFNYIYGKIRMNLKGKLQKFLDKKNPKLIYPICGPHGTGKTISALIYHKLLFSNGIKGLYLNLKYYCSENVPWEKKVDVLLKECFFICDNKEDLLSIYNKIIIKEDIYEVMRELKDLIIKKNNKDEDKDKNKEKIYVILDQYQDKYNMNYLLKFFSSVKVILLSSINDFDVKDNILLTYVEEIQNDFNSKNKVDSESESKKIIKYHYIDNLIEEGYYNNNIFKELIKNKIRNKLKKEEKIKNEKEKNNESIEVQKKGIKKGLRKEKNKELTKSNKDRKTKGKKIEKEKEEIEEGNNLKEKELKIEEGKILKEEEKVSEKEEIKIEEEFKFIHYILKKFDYIPKYFFEYLNNYDSIFTLLFNEYSNIMKKLTYFANNGIINIEKINDLIKNRNLIRKDKLESVQTLDKINFIQNIKYVPLKYINFRINNKGEFYFYYSFPFFKTILKDFIEFRQNANSVFNIRNPSQKGINFEAIIKYVFRVEKKFDIDGYIKVDKIINMQPTKKYLKIEKDYFKSKKNIFIEQKCDGEDYDFAIYKSEENLLLLLQSKYLISDANVSKSKSLYTKTANMALESFNALTNLNLSEVHLLFISSVYFNYGIKDDAVDTLNKKRINCIFYSLKTDQFYFNFKDAVREINLNKNTMVLPSSEYHKGQIALVNPEFKEVHYAHNNANVNKKEKKIKDKDNSDSKDEKNSDTIYYFLKRKTVREKEELKTIYDDIMIYIKDKSKFDNQSIIDLLGSIKEIESYREDGKYNKKSEYIIMLYLNEENLRVDYKKKNWISNFS